MKKYIISLLIFCMIACGTSVLAADNSKGVAIVDVQKVVMNSAEVKKLENTRINQEKELREFLINAKKTVDAESNPDKKKELQDNFNKELNQKVSSQRKYVIETTAAIEKDILAAIEKEAKDLGYDMVIQKGSVLYGGSDITNKILKKVK